MHDAKGTEHVSGDERHRSFLNTIKEETIMVLMGVSTIGIIAAFFYIRRRTVNSQKKEKLFRKLKMIAAITELNIIKTDYFSNKLLALDLLGQKLVFLDYHNYKNNVIIDLDDVEECKLIVKRLTIQLEIIFKDPLKAPYSIVFYQKFVSPEALRRHLTSKSRQWKRKISEILSNKTEPQVALSY